LINIYLVISYFIFLFPNILLASSTSRIEGVADFLIERANDNYLYIFEQRLKNNEMLKFYLPTTYQILNSADLKILLSSTGLWKNSVEKDLEQLSAKVLNHITKSQLVFPTQIRLRERFIKNAINSKIKIDNREYSLTVMDINTPQNNRDIFDEIWNPYLETIDTLEKIVSKITGANIFRADYPRLIAFISNGIEQLWNFQSKLKTNEYEITELEELLEGVQSIQFILEDISSVLESLKLMTDDSLEYSIRVLSSFMVIDYLKENFPPKELKGKYDKFYEQFKIYSLFFAQLSDANSSEEVKAILKAVTVPSTSFGLKRKPLEFHVSTSSYFGICGGLSKRNGDTKNFVGLSAPIGIEFSYGFAKYGSVSLLFELMDFGPAVNSQLYNIDTNISFNEIINPGITIYYGLKHLPVAIGLGINGGQDIFTDGKSQGSIFVSLNMDMPLFMFY